MTRGWAKTMTCSALVGVLSVATSCSPGTGAQRPQAAAGSEGGGAGGRSMLVTNAIWTPSAEVIEALGLTDEQVQAIRASETRCRQQAFEARRVEQRALMRFIRVQGAANATPETVEAARKAAVEATIARVEAALERVEKLRALLTIEQWRDVVSRDPTAVQIGWFKPQVAFVEVGDVAGLDSAVDDDR